MSRVLFSIGILQVLTILVGLFRAKGLSVLLGPAGFGIVSTIDQVVLTLMYLGALGLPFTALRYMARSHSEGVEQFRRTTAGFLRVLAALAVLMTVLASAVLAWRPSLFGADLVPYRTALQLALLGVPVVMLNVLFVNVLAAGQRPMAAAGLNLLTAAALALAAVAGVWAYGIPGLYVATAVLGLLAIGAAFLYLRGTLGLRLTGVPPGAVRELRAQPDIVSSSAYVYVLFTASSLALLALRHLVLSRLGEAPAGLLHASLSIALTVGAVLSPMSNLYLAPLVNRQLPLVDKVHAANEFAAKTLVLLLAGALPVVLFPHLFLAILFTPAFAAASATMFLFVVWQCLQQVANVYQQLLIGLDDVRYTATAGAVSQAATATLALVLVPAVGLAGAPIALTVGTLLYGVLAIARLHYRFGVGAPPYVMGRAAYVTTAVIGAGVLFAARPEWTVRELGARAGYAALAILLLVALLRPDERRMLRDAPTALLRRVGLGRVQSSPVL